MPGTGVEAGGPGARGRRGDQLRAELRRLGERLPGGRHHDRRRHGPSSGGGPRRATTGSSARSTDGRRGDTSRTRCSSRPPGCGPRGRTCPRSVPWLRSNAAGFDVVVFVTYLYATTWAGLPEAAALAPTVLLPAAHDEPPFWLPLFDLTLRMPTAYAFLTEEEQALVERRTRARRPSRGDRPRRGPGGGRGRGPVPRTLRHRRAPVPALHRPARSGQGIRRAVRLLHDLQGAAPGRSGVGGRGRAGETARAPSRRHHHRLRPGAGEERRHGRVRRPHHAQLLRELFRWYSPRPGPSPGRPSSTVTAMCSPARPSAAAAPSPTGGSPSSRPPSTCCSNTRTWRRSGSSGSPVCQQPLSVEARCWTNSSTCAGPPFTSTARWFRPWHRPVRPVRMKPVPSWARRASLPHRRGRVAIDRPWHRQGPPRPPRRRPASRRPPSRSLRPGGRATARGRGEPG